MRKIFFITTCLVVIPVLCGATGFDPHHSKVSNEAKDNYDLANTFYKQGKFEEALKIFTMIVNCDPSSPIREGSLYGAGLCLMQMKLHDEAKKIWEKILKEYPNGEYAARTYYQMAEYLRYVRDEADAAMEYYKKASIPEAIFRIAEFYLGQGELAKARDYFKKALETAKEQELVDRIRIGLGRANVGLLTSPALTPESQIYVVKEGDTLSGIARQFNMEVELLMACNGLKNEIIKPHQRLKVIKKDYRIIIDKERHTLTLMMDGEFFSQYRVATGLRTPVGKFKVVNKFKDPVWYSPRGVIEPGSPKNLLGSRWIGLDIPGYGIHGTKNPNDLGKTVTRGCIRMREEELKELFKLIPLGTEVEIIGGV